jgi:hypothetical protein
MAKYELRAGVVGFGSDEVSALLHGLAEGGIEEIEYFCARRGGDGADGLVCLQAERTSWIAECGIG